MLGSMALLGLGIFGPGIATGLVSGAPQLGAGAAVGTMAAIGAGALAGGAAADAGIKSTISAGSSAIKAGASLAGGTRMAFTLGSMGAGGGLKGAAAGLGAVAQAGVMSVVQAGGTKLASAGGAITTAHSSGMRNGMAALSKGMKRAPKMSTETDAASGPNWAKKLHRQQQTRQAGHAARSAMRGADSGGSGTGPSLNPDS